MAVQASSSQQYVGMVQKKNKINKNNEKIEKIVENKAHTLQIL